MKFVLVALSLVALASATGTVKASADDIKCTACTTVVSIVDTLLDDGKTQQEIEQLVSKTCKMLGPKYSDVCSRIAAIGIEELIKYVEALSPEKVCEKLKLCQPLALDADTKCLICETVITLVRPYIEKGVPVDQIEQFIAKTCKATPLAKDICDVIAQLGVEQLIELVKKYTDPEKLCTMLKLCTAQ